MSALHPDVFERVDMREAVAPARRAAKALRASAAAWATVAVAGQLFLATYIAWVYAGSALRGDLAGYNRVLSKAWVAGDTVLNLVLAVHLAFAAMILVSGALQLLPAIRRRVPALHRWNGRVYLASAAMMSLGGLAYSWTRAQIGDAFQQAGTTLNAALILGCAALAWRHARHGRLDAHRRWALRLFLVVSGAWFFRIGLMLWLVLNRGPVGFDPETFTGPFLSVMSFAQYLLPLAVLELYFAAQRSRRGGAKAAMAAGLAVATLATLAGTAAAAMGLWLPHLN